MKKVLKQVLTIACSVFIIAYTIMQLSLTSSDSVETEHAFYSVVNEVLSTTAYIFRDETVVMQSGGGTPSYSVENGEKVHVGQELCINYQNSDEAGAQETINKLNAQIELLNKSSIDGASFSTDLSKINSDISSYMLSIQKSVAAGDLSAAARLHDDLLIQMNRRQATVADSKDFFGTQISTLTQKKNMLEQALNGVKVVTSAATAGYFYSAADGYEKTFCSSALDSVTASEFNALIKTSPDESILNGSVGKIAESSKWYLAFVATRREAAFFTEGNKYSVSFVYSSDKELKMQYEGARGDTKDDEVVLVFSTNSLVSGFNLARKQEVKVIKKALQGLKVRTSALVNVNGQTGVYSLSIGRVVFKTAEVICETGGFYLIKLPNESNPSERSSEKLSLHDAVLIGGKNLYVGKVLS